MVAHAEAASQSNEAWLDDYDRAAAEREAAQPASDVPSWRKPATAFAYLNFAEDAVWITGPARAVLWALAKRVDYETGGRYLYVADIMERAGIRDEKTCRRAIRTLRALGVLEVEQGRKRPRQVKPAPRWYRLVIPQGYRD